MKVIHIIEENHGHIGTAVSMKAAWQFIVNKGWLGFWDAVYIFDEWVGIDEIFEQNGWNKTNENLVEWAMNRGVDAWDGLFYFAADELIEED